MDTLALDKIITGRVHPHIYAFRTGTIPNYLKVGDTYRPVEVRLDEWRSKYESLEEVFREEASVSKDVFFRDFAIHQYFEEVLMLHRLEKPEIPEDVYYSNEFFKGATEENVETAIEDIHDDFSKGGNHYHFYKFDESRIPVEAHYVRSEKPFTPRKEQEQTVKKFLAAKEAGRKNLLMYAVMRFGKSFTSMLCAKEMNAKLVIVLCGKTSVEDEWKRNVEIPRNFEDYSFKTRTDLDTNHHLISEAKLSGEKIVLFLTLQDLSGDDVKERHKELFENEIDLIIVDETHFGARAPEYGKVLQEEFGITKAISKKEYQEDDMEALDTTLKLFHTNLKLHLSGTPYRILMGSEFAPEDVIAFYQFTDIVDAQQKWACEHLDDPDKKEWDNPYYGFPQMVRFAFNPSNSARKLIKELREKGMSCALSALFQPESIVKDTEGKYRNFKHEQEVFELLEVIDGSREDDELFSFLNYDRIKDGQMCRHIVCVLPFRASCDALQYLIENNKDKFRNLSDYQILNIAGHECPASLQKPTGVKEAISKAEGEEKKTITLTVNKMLTGSTVEQWDTILFFKDTASPQEYDQAIFRIQNPFIKTMKAPEAETNQQEIKFNMKPQTLLVDFDIDRLFQLQALKSQIFNSNVDANGNAKLEERMKRELEISPVIVLNKDKLQEITPNDIMEAVSEYSKTRSVADEAKDIPVDMRLINDPVIKDEIDRQGTIASKEGLSVKPSKGDGEDVDSGDDSGTGALSGEVDSSSKAIKEKDTPEELFRKRFATYYSRILFYTFLSESPITNLDELIASIDGSDNNHRIAKNLELKKEILAHLRLVIDGNKLGALEFKIRNLNHLVSDVDLLPLDRAKTAMRRFSRLSEAEITTPENIARGMVSILPTDCTAENKFLDIAAKQGEFAIALVERFGEAVKGKIWSLPTSGVAYEFTRKIYEFLGMPVENIYSDFNSFGLIENNQYIDLLNAMKFDVIIGNPPYQAPKATERAGINKAFSSAIYPSFIDVARTLRPKYISLITPSRWMTGTGQGISEAWVSELINCGHFINLQDYYDSTDCFKDVELKGGVSYFIYSDDYHGECNYVLHQAGKVFEKKGILNALGTGILLRDPKAMAIIDKIKKIEGDYFKDGRSFSKLVGPQHFFDKDGKLTTRWKGYKLKKSKCYNIKYYLNRQVESQGYAWIKETDIPKNTEIIHLHKVYLSKAFNGGDAIPHQIIGHAFYGEPGSVCSQTYLVLGWNQSEHQLSELECKNIITYMNTRFFRYLVFIKKKTQDNPTAVFTYAPLQDFSKSWSDSELYNKYHLTEDEINFIETTIKPMD